MADRPNILFIHVDQLRPDRIGIEGCASVQTPAIDRLCREGTRFGIHESANPVCCPARTSWYTGRCSLEHGVLANGKFAAPATMPTLGSALEKVGYRSFYAGKWHVPGIRPEEQFTMLTHGDPHGERGDPAVARAASAFLSRYDDARPFFLSVGFLNPHDCCYMFGAPASRRLKMGMNDKLAGTLPANDPTWEKPPPQGNYKDFDDDILQLYTYCYDRMVEMVDAEIGRVYDTLMRSRHRDNTLIVFSSDHGEMLGAHGRLGKSDLREPACRVPLAFVMPDRIDADRLDASSVTGGLDVPATILDYAGADLLPGMNFGESLRPALESRETLDREYVASITMAGGGQIGVRSRTHKSIHALASPDSGKTQLYDLGADPLESKNLAQQATHTDVVAKHTAFARSYIRERSLSPAAEDVLAGISKVKGGDESY